MIPPFRIRNCHSHPIRLIIKPVATDYTFLPDEMVELAVDAQPPDAYLHIDYQERHIMIWEEGGTEVGWLVVMKGEEVLEYGYQREEWNRYCRDQGLLSEVYGAPPAPA